VVVGVSSAEVLGKLAYHSE
jgi:hypothetical protein